MKEVERQAFNNRCESEGLSSLSCALKGAVDYDAAARQKHSVERTPIESVFDTFSDSEYTKHHARSASASADRGRLLCELCDQSISVRGRQPDEESAYEIEVSFPVRCLAYKPERISDIEATRRS